MNSVQINTITAPAEAIVANLTHSILATFQTAAQSIQQQVTLAIQAQRQQAQESILDWLVQRRTNLEAQLENDELNSAQVAFATRRIESLDQEISALLESAGVVSPKRKAPIRRVTKKRTQRLTARNGGRKRKRK